MQNNAAKVNNIAPRTWSETWGETWGYDPEYRYRPQPEMVFLTDEMKETLRSYANTAECDALSAEELEQEYYKRITELLLTRQVERAKIIINNVSPLKRDQNGEPTDNYEGNAFVIVNDGYENAEPLKQLREAYHGLAVITYSELINQKAAPVSLYKDCTYLIVLDPPDDFQKRQALEKIKDGILCPILRPEDPAIYDKFYNDHFGNDRYKNKQRNPDVLFSESFDILEEYNRNSSSDLNQLADHCLQLERLDSPNGLLLNIEPYIEEVMEVLNWLINSCFFNDTRDPSYLAAVRIISRYPKARQLLFYQSRHCANVNNNLTNALLLSVREDVNKRLNTNAISFANRTVHNIYLSKTPNKGFKELTDKEMHEQLDIQLAEIQEILAHNSNNGGTDLNNKIVQSFQYHYVQRAIDTIMHLETLKPELQTRLCLALYNLNAIANTEYYSDNPFIRWLQKWRWFGCRPQPAIGYENVSALLEQKLQQQPQQQPNLQSGIMCTS